MWEIFALGMAQNMFFDNFTGFSWKGGGETAHGPVSGVCLTMRMQLYSPFPALFTNGV